MCPPYWARKMFCGGSGMLTTVAVLTSTVASCSFSHCSIITLFSLCARTATCCATCQPESHTMTHGRGRRPPQMHVNGMCTRTQLGC